jgi:hypothetical protein
MSMYFGENDGRFPVGARVEVKYWPRSRGLTPEREKWPWLPGEVLGQCGPHEWHVCVDDGGLADEPDEAQDRLFPGCFRGESEIRLASAATVPRS